MKTSRLLFLVFLITGQATAQDTFYQKLADAAQTLVKDEVAYDPSYFSIGYPNGDVPKDKGVCTDVVIRTYRKLGIDLQQRVHEDMAANFTLYPSIWGLKRPDKNIDHRRVPNLMVFFERFGTSLEPTKNAKDYAPGDIVSWDLGGGKTHIGVVTGLQNRNGNRYLIMHNIGAGQVLQDCLFDFKIIGHYRYRG